MTGRALGACVAAWALLAAGGFALSSVPLTVGAPLVLIAVPILVVRRLRPGEFDPLEPIWAALVLFGFTYLVVPPLAALRPQTFATLPGYHDTPPAQHLYACWIGALAFLALVLGYWAPVGPRLGRLLAVGGRGSPVIAAQLGAVLLAAGAASVAYAVHVSGISVTPGTLFGGDLRTGVISSFSGRGYLTVGFTMLMLSSPCLAYWAASYGSRRRWLLAAMATLLALVLLGGFAGSRIGVLAVCAGVLTVVHYRVRRVPLRLVALACLALAAVGITQGTLRDNVVGGGLLSPLGTLAKTLDGFAFLIDALARVQDFELGRTLAEDIGLTYVPRGLWPDKPTVFGFVRAQEAVVPGLFRDSAYSATFPVGVVAEGYVNFAIAGAVGLPLLAGVLLRAVYVAARDSGSAFWLLLLAWLLPNLVSLMRGFATTVLTMLLGAVFLAPMLLGRHGR